MGLCPVKLNRISYSSDYWLQIRLILSISIPIAPPIGKNPTLQNDLSPRESVYVYVQHKTPAGWVRLA